MSRKPTEMVCSIKDNKSQPPAYRGEAAAHVSVGHREVGLVDGLLKDQVDDAFEPFFCVDGQVCNLLHQLVELLRGQLVQDATDLSEELLRRIKDLDRLIGAQALEGATLCINGPLLVFLASQDHLQGFLSSIQASRHSQTSSAEHHHSLTNS